MKNILTILLIIAQHIVLNAGEVIVTSSITTNLTAKAWQRTDVYTRDGQRILEIQKTSSLDGEVWTREQMVIWQDRPAVKLTTVSVSAGTSHGIHFYAGVGVDAVASWNENNTLRGVSLVATNNEFEVQAGFTVVDGMLSPMPTREIEMSNAAVRDVGNIFRRFIGKESTGDQFLEEVGDILTKYGTTNGHNKGVEPTVVPPVAHP